MIGASAATPLTFPTPSGDPGVTHPSVVHAPGGFAGHAYWMALTPYNGSNDEDENPCVYYSDDGDQWTPIRGNPIAPAPPWGHHSDTYLLLHDWLLVCVWRISSHAEGTEIVYATSGDGETWTAPAQMWRDTSRFLLSPSIIRTGDHWQMFTVERIVGGMNVVRRHTADALAGPWVEAPCSGIVAGPGREPWHLNVTHDGTLWHALLNDTANEKNGGGGGLFYSSSRDGATWNTPETCIPTVGAWHTTLYQAAAVSDPSGVDVWYSSATPQWRIGRSRLIEPLSPPPPPAKVTVELPSGVQPGQVHPLNLTIGDSTYQGQATIDPFMQGDNIVTFGILASAHVPFAVDYATEVLADSPLAYYRLHDPTSTTDLSVMTDSSGNGYDGRYRNGADVSASGLIAGDSDTAVDLDGTQRAEVVDAAWMDTLTGDVSVEMWCKPDAVSGIYDGVTRFDNTGANPFLLGINSNFRFLCTTSTNTAQAAWGTTPTIGNTYHVVGTYNSTSGAVTLYVNGSSVATATMTGAGSLEADGAARIGIGARLTGAVGSRFFDGVIDEVAIYDSELSSTRVLAHYNAGT